MHLNEISKVFPFYFEQHLLWQTFFFSFFFFPDLVILFPAVIHSSTKSHPTQEQPGNINWPLRYPLMDRTHFISNLTFNEYIFYLPMPVIGMSSTFREMVVLGLFWTDLFSSTGTCTPITHCNWLTISPCFFLFPLCLQYGSWINNSWSVIRASSIGDLLMEGRCSASVPRGMLRVVVSAPICQNAIRQTMEALISTSRPIIFKWLLAEECNQSITTKSF